jgi:hypothetical protein
VNKHQSVKRPAPASDKAIEVRVSDISQLFDTLDPFPFPERDLDKDAEEFIVGWARELPRDHRLDIVIHVPAAEIKKHDGKDVGSAMNRYFDYRAGVIGRDLKELFRVGRLSLAIGLTVLAVTLAATQGISGRLNPTPLARFLEESLIIVGWVANWRPIEIFLYDWWPLVRRRNLYRRLARACVELRPDKKPHLDGVA